MIFFLVDHVKNLKIIKVISCLIYSGLHDNVQLEADEFELSYLYKNDT